MDYEEDVNTTPATINVESNVKVLNQLNVNQVFVAQTLPRARDNEDQANIQRLQQVAVNATNESQQLCAQAQVQQAQYDAAARQAQEAAVAAIQRADAAE